MRYFKSIDSEHAINMAGHHIKGFDERSLITAEEISGGNMNVIYRVVNKSTGVSIIVKQAPPYIRVIGESWPLTQQRIEFEYNALNYFKRYSPKNVVSTLFYDKENSCLFMEDLDDCITWRQALIIDAPFADKAQEIGCCMAEIYFHSSKFFLDEARKDLLQVQFHSPEMCATTATVFFDDPYYECERNNIRLELKKAVEKLWGDQKIRYRVEQLKRDFLSRPEALLHGDFHSGSVLVSETRCKLIDAEFAFFGPIGFDVGTAIANLTLSYCCKVGINSFEARNRITGIIDLWQNFSSRFFQRATSIEGNVEIAEFLSKVWQDTLGYAGTEIIRRTIGIAQIDDFNACLSEQESIEAKRLALDIGQWLLSTPHEDTTLADVCDFLESHLAF